MHSDELDGHGMNDEETKPLSAARRSAIKFQLGLRAEIDALLAAEAPTTLDRLMRLSELKVPLRRISDSLRLDEFYLEIETRTAELAERYLTETSEARPEARLTELSAQTGDRRTTKLLVEYLHARKRQHIGAAIKAGACTWDRTLTPADHYGHGMDERIIEIPLAVDVCRFASPGRVLDAGCALNHGYIRELIDPPVASLVHFTQSGQKEESHFAGGQVSYVFGDMRAMPFPDSHFDRIVCISTLEHVGMDNGRYGSAAEHEPGSSLAAVRDLMRVLKPGGALLITVPFGAPVDLGWFRVFGPQDIADVAVAAAASSTAVRYYRAAGAWVSSSEDEAQMGDSVGSHRAIGGMAAIRLVK